LFLFSASYFRYDVVVLSVCLQTVFFLSHGVVFKGGYIPFLAAFIYSALVVSSSLCPLFDVVYAIDGVIGLRV
jgi:hypothetical protein